MILQPGYWVVLLNDMRSANFENVQPVACAETREELEAFVEGQRVKVYQDDGGGPGKCGHYGTSAYWGKSFCKGGPLEWFNPPYDDPYVQWWPQDAPDIPHFRDLAVK